VLPPSTEDLVADYAHLFGDLYPTALLADSAFRTGARLEVPSSGLRALDPGAKPAGPAVTVRANNDLVSILEAVHRAAPGDVVVIANSTRDVGLIGDLIGAEAMRKELGGFVVDGLVRDRAELIELGVPVACRGTYPVGPLKVRAEERGIGVVGEPVDIGGAPVTPGMWAFGDDDGVIFLDAADLDTVFAAAAKAAEQEEDLAADIRAGTPLGEAFALDAFLEERRRDPAAVFGEHLERVGRAI
jgi:regulator of RNase E activity RraA